MKTLERFWHWQRNERPSPERTREMRAKHLSPLAEHCIQLAVKELVRRRPVDQDLEQLDEQLVTLSLAFCRALSDMHEAVPEPPKPEPPKPKPLATVRLLCGVDTPAPSDEYLQQLRAAMERGLSDAGRAAVHRYRSVTSDGWREV